VAVATIHNTLGEAWTAEIGEAWRRGFAAVGRVMLDAHLDERAATVEVP
jgi:hypothetical protein